MIDSILNTQLEGICAKFFDECGYTNLEVGAFLPQCEVFAKLVQVHHADLVQGGGVHVFNSFQHPERHVRIRQIVFDHVHGFRVVGGAGERKFSVVLKAFGSAPCNVPVDGGDHVGNGGALVDAGFQGFVVKMFGFHPQLLSLCFVVVARYL